MTAWRNAWRVGYYPLMSNEAVKAILDGLLADDEKIIQSATTSPPPLQCVQDWPCEGADPIGYGAWKGDGLETVGEVEEYFARMCFEADKRMGEPAGCRWFLNWWDETPRHEARVKMVWELRYLRYRDIINGSYGFAGRVSPGILKALDEAPEVTINWMALADVLEELGWVESTKVIRHWLQEVI